MYANDICVDEHNDIIIFNNDLPIIRGGWSDRYGKYYDKGISIDGFGAVNIKVRNTTNDTEILQQSSRQNPSTRFNVPSDTDTFI